MEREGPLHAPSSCLSKRWEEQAVEAAITAAQARRNGVATAFWAEIRGGITPDEALLQEPAKRGRRKQRLLRTLGGRVERR